MTDNLPILNSAPVVSDMIPITAVAHPLRISREILYVAAGETVRATVERAIPEAFWKSVLVTINDVVIESTNWSVTTVRENDIIVFRALPQGGSGSKLLLRTVITLAIMAIAFAVAGPAGSAIAGATGIGLQTATFIAFTAANLIGQLALNALIPPSSLTGNSKATFGISGIQNQEIPYGVVPRVYGRSLITPPKGAHSYTVTKNNDVYLHALFDLGPGPVKITDVKIGQTPIDSFDDVEYEIREGRDDDDPLTLYTNAVTQTQLYTAFADNGDNATQRTPDGTTHIEVDLTAPGGLFHSKKEGGWSSIEVDFNIEVFRVSNGSRVHSGSKAFTGQSSSMITDTYTVPVLPADQYDVKVTRTTDQHDQTRTSDLMYWTAIRTWKPSSGPLLPQNHAKIAVLIKATEQLNGDITSLNCIAQAYVQVWDGTGFTEALNTHPAWAALNVLTGNSNARPISTDRVALDSLLQWSQIYPSAEFNYVFGGRTTIWQALRTIGSAGRALPVIRDGQYAFVFDYTHDTPVQLFTPRTISNFKAAKAYLDDVQAMEVRYVSETMGWQEHSIYVYADGFDANNVDGNKISTLDLTGVTSDDWAYKLGSYFFAAAILRATTYTFDTDLDHLACNPGDRVKVQHDVVGSGLVSGRISAITRVGGSITTVTLDESLTPSDAESYGIMLRGSEGAIYSGALSFDSETTTNVYTLTTPLVDHHDIAPGDLASLYTTETAILDGIVKTITPKADFKATVTLLDYAPSVHNGDHVTPPPVVNDRIDKFVHSLPVSSVVIRNVTIDRRTSSSGGITYRIHGVYVLTMDGVTPSAFQLQYRVRGDTGWTAMPNLPLEAREFFIPLPNDSTGATYDIRLRGINRTKANPGPWDQVSLVVADTTVAPATPDDITVTPIVGGVKVDITDGGYGPKSKYKLYATTDVTADFAAATKIAEESTVEFQVIGLSTVLYKFWATAVDGAGVESTPVGPVFALPLPVGYDNLQQDVQDFLDYVSDTTRLAREEISQIAQALTLVGVGNYADVLTIRTEYSAGDAAVTADFVNELDLATGPGSAIVSDITTLQAALNGYTGANAVSTAVTGLQTQVTTNAGNISTNSTAITNLQSALTGYTGANAVASAVTTLQTQITTNAGNITTNSAAITSLQSALTGYTGANAVSTAINSLQTQTTTNAGNITTNSAAITSLQSALTGYTGANAVATAITGLNTSISTTNGNVTALSSSLTSLTSTVGNFSASGLFRVSTQTAPSGASARIAMAVAATSGGATYAAGIYIDAITTGVNRSNITCIANQFFITDGTNSDSPFLFSGGTLYLDSAKIQSLSATKIVGGTLDVGVINAGAINATKLAVGAAQTNNASVATQTNGLISSYSNLGQVSVTANGTRPITFFMSVLTKYPHDIVIGGSFDGTLIDGLTQLDTTLTAIPITLDTSAQAGWTIQTVPVATFVPVTGSETVRYRPTAKDASSNSTNPVYFTFWGEQNIR